MRDDQRRAPGPGRAEFGRGGEIELAFHGHHGRVRVFME